jgi:putative DNA primase/helicase
MERTFLPEERLARLNERVRAMDKKPSTALVVPAQNKGSLAVQNPIEEVWPSPEPIRIELRAVKPLLEEMIPEPLRLWLNDVAYRMQVPLDYVAAATIVMISSVIGSGCGIRPKRRDDWLVVPNLWGGVVGRPGMLKSPALEAALRRPLQRLEAVAQEKFEEAEAEFELEEKRYQARQKAAEKAMADAAKKEIKSNASSGELDRIQKDLAGWRAPEPPVHRRYVTNDVTIQKMSVLQAQNPRGLLIFRDELTGFLATLDKEDRQSDRAFHLQAWNGNGADTVDTIGRGTIRVANLCESIFGGIQPSKLNDYLYESVRNIANDGLIQRFQVLVYPDEPRNWKLVDQFPDNAQKNRAFAIVESLAQMDFTDHGAIQEEDEKIPWLRFSEDAQEFFNSWLTKLQTEKLGAGEDEPIMQEHLSKFRSLMPSLALIFHLIEVADGTASGAVGKHSAERAAQWCDYLESHASRIYGLVQNASMQGASRLARKIQDGALTDGFTARDIYHKQWTGLDDPGITKSALEELVDAGWIRPRSVPVIDNSKGGRPPLPSYEINPQLSKTDLRISDVPKGGAAATT